MPVPFEKSQISSSKRERPTSTASCSSEKMFDTSNTIWPPVVLPEANDHLAVGHQAARLLVHKLDDGAQVLRVFDVVGGHGELLGAPEAPFVASDGVSASCALPVEVVGASRLPALDVLEYVLHERVGERRPRACRPRARRTHRPRRGAACSSRTQSNPSLRSFLRLHVLERPLHDRVSVGVAFEVSHHIRPVVHGERF